MPRERGFVQLIAIALVALAATVGILFYQSKKIPGPVKNSLPIPVTLSNNNEKTYTDPVLGFNLQYPAGFQLIADTEEAYSKRHSTDYKTNFVQTWGYDSPALISAITLQSDKDPFDLEVSPFTLWVFDNPHNLDASQWYQDYWYYPFLWGEYEPQKSTDSPDKEASVSGRPANYHISTSLVTQPKFIYVSQNNKMFLFRVIDQNGSNLGSQMLSSLKFL